ncbi:MAG: thiamine phosphate synthase [Xanthobacteraceae bacterium]|uniref:thiamine phosphate synthase n=1 Tax=Pseudolabrys sp. TaxID=1960880 RepID=UPI003D13127C
MNAVDLRLYALLDPDNAGGHDLPRLAELIAPDTTLVQLRDKHGTTREMIARARALHAVLSPRRIFLLINDRVDVALACGAEGVHVGWDDMEAADVRRLLGPKAIVGLSIKSVRQADAAPLEMLDYVAIGGVFTTISKNNPDPPVGLDGFRTILAAIRKRAPHMLVAAIAGIDAGNAGDVVAAGADGVSVISALSRATDPAAAAKSLRGVIDAALAKRGAR